MSLEGRKFHFARDDDGHIYAENEIETEIANREGWLLSPRKGERVTKFYDAVCGTGRVEVVRETTGELIDGSQCIQLSKSEKSERMLSHRRYYRKTHRGLPIIRLLIQIVLR